MNALTPSTDERSTTRSVRRGQVESARDRQGVRHGEGVRRGQARVAREPVGRLDAVRERYFAVSVERRLKHPAVVAISEAANEMLTRRKK